MIPQVKLGSSACKVSGVELSEHRGSPEGLGPEVEDEIDERIEFVLGELNGHIVVNAGCSSAYILCQQGLRLIIGNSESRCNIGPRVAISDCPNADLILISSETATFKLLRQSEAVGTIGQVIQAHQRIPPINHA